MSLLRYACCFEYTQEQVETLKELWKSYNPSKVTDYTEFVLSLEERKLQLTHYPNLYAQALLWVLHDNGYPKLRLFESLTLSL